MNHPATEMQGLTLSLTREFNAPRDMVFQAWTDPGMLAQWMGPKEVETVAAEVDLKVGGRYRFSMKEADGKIIDLGGVYREIDPPAKLVFTWVLDDQGCEGSQGQHAETLVTVEFQDLGTSTRLILTHDFLPGETSRQAHAMGWEGSFDGLAEVLA